MPSKHKYFAGQSHYFTLTLMDDTPLEPTGPLEPGFDFATYDIRQRKNTDNLVICYYCRLVKEKNTAWSYPHISAIPDTPTMYRWMCRDCGIL